MFMFNARGSFQEISHGSTIEIFSLIFVSISYFIQFRLDQDHRLHHHISQPHRFYKRINMKTIVASESHTQIYELPTRIIGGFYQYCLELFNV
jgi:hypothetical protein